VGFRPLTTLSCYRGSLDIKDTISSYEIKELIDLDWKLMKTFWDYSPTWQNSILAVDNLKERLLCLGAFWDSQMVGYVIYKPKGKRIMQMAVNNDHRNQGIGSQLLEEIAKRSQREVVTIINVDNRIVSLNGLLEKCGMDCFIKQYEMVMNI